MARPRRDDGKTYLHIHNDKGHLYAASRDPRTNDAGKRVFTMTIWGTLDGKLAFHPNTRFIYARDRWDCFVFPDDWDLSEVGKLREREKPGRPPYDGEAQSRLYGSVWFLLEVARKMELYQDVLHVLGGDKARTDDIMTLALYPVLSRRCFNSLHIWQSIERMPTHDRLLLPKDVTLIGEGITEQNRLDLFSRRMSRIDKGDVLAIDSTSKSTYGTGLADIRWGKNKEGLVLPQTNEVVVYSLQKHYPVFAMQLPGNIPDVRTVGEIYTNLDHAGLKSFTFLTDRGYTSESVVDFLISRSNPFICAAKTTTRAILDVIDQVEAGEIEMEVDEGSGLYCTQMAMSRFIQKKDGQARKASGLRLNLYLDDVRRANEKRDMMVVIQRQRNELSRLLESQEVVADADELRRTCGFHEFTLDSKGRVASFSRLDDKMERSLRTCGYFASYSFKVSGTAAEIQETYKRRDEQEKLFWQMKSLAGDDRNRTWNELSHTGRRFIFFITISLLSYTKWVWKKEGLDRTIPTVQQVIDEMKCIRAVEHRGKAKIITPFVGKQLDICEAFGIDVPEGCKPAKRKTVDSSTGKKKRGRPPKQKEEDLS